MSRLPLQIAAIVGVTILLFVGWDFAQRIAVTLRSQQAEQELDREITRAQATKTALLAQKQYAQTDAFVEDRARANNYVRDGEFIVHPLVTPAAAGPTPAVPAATPAPVTNPVERVSSFFQDLIEFLFGP